MPTAEADRNLLFGVLALQCGLLDAKQFAEACGAWASRKDTPLADLLVERGILTGDDKAAVLSLLERTLRKHAGDAHASLVAVAGDHARRTLLEVRDPVIQQTLSFPKEEASGQELPSTLPHMAGTRERYALTRVHGRGGIGQVWVARDEALGREVALKELLPEMARNPALRARFMEEAKVTAQLEHPGIVSVHELSEHPVSGEPFYTMRLLKGRTLADAIRDYHERRKAGKAALLNFRELLSNFASVCNAVAYAHSRGVLHRDLKPQNVVLGDYGEVVVLDWGLAKLKGNGDGHRSLPAVAVERDSSRGETLQGMVLGTPGYMAKEQAEGRIDLIDERTDVSGLGAILYEILTGAPPFTGANTHDIIAKAVLGNIVPPRQLVPTTPRPLESVCLKALANQPSGRYASAKAIADELQRWLADEPVEAAPEPLRARAGRWMRRHRGTVTAVAVAIAVTLVSVTVGALLLSYANSLATMEAKRALRLDNEVKQAILAQSALLDKGAETIDNAGITDEELFSELLRVGAIWERLVTERPGEMFYQYQLANNLLARSEHCPPDTSQRERANADIAQQQTSMTECLCRAVPFWEDLLRKQPLNELFRRKYRETLIKIAYAYTGPGDIGRATYWWNKVRVAHSYRDGFITCSNFEGAAIADLRVCELQARSGDLKEASVSVERALTAVSQAKQMSGSWWSWPPRADPVDILGASIRVMDSAIKVHAVGHGVVAKDAESLEKLEGIADSEHYNAAFGYVRAALGVLEDRALAAQEQQKLREQYLRRAVGSLSKIKADSIEACFIKSDPAFDVMRGRDEFKRLLQSQEKKGGAKQARRKPAAGEK